MPLSVWWCPCYCLSLVTSLPVAFISVALSCHLFSTDNGSAASLWAWHKKAYYGKIKCNLKHPWFQGLLTQTHRDWCVYPIMDTHTYACFALHPFVPNAHVCKCTEMHTWPTARYCFLSLALSFCSTVTFRLDTGWPKIAMSTIKLPSIHIPFSYLEILFHPAQTYPSDWAKFYIFLFHSCM